MQQGFFSIQQTCPTCHGTGKVIPDPTKNPTGICSRVPTSDVSGVDLTVELSQETSYEATCPPMKPTTCMGNARDKITNG